MRENVASSTHGTETHRERLKPAPKPQGDPSMDFQRRSDGGLDMKVQILRDMCSTFGNAIDKLEHFSSQ